MAFMSERDEPKFIRAEQVKVPRASVTSSDVASGDDCDVSIYSSRPVSYFRSPSWRNKFSQTIQSILVVPCVELSFLAAILYDKYVKKLTM